MSPEETMATFESFDGVRLEGVFRAPVGDLRGLSLFVHGMTADRHEWGTFDSVAEMFAGRGIGSLRWDYRCHGTAATVLDHELTLAGICNDIDSAFRALRERAAQGVPIIVVAASFGAGVAVRWAVERRKKKLDLLVLLYPVLDYEADVSRVNPKWRQELGESGGLTYGPKRLGRPFACELARSRLAGELNSAASITLICHGISDSDVPIEESERAAAANDQTKLFKVEGDHGFAAANDPDLETAASQRNVRQMVRLLEEEMARIGL